MKLFKLMRNSDGATIVESLVAMGIVLILTGGLSTVMKVANEQNDKLSKASTSEALMNEIKYSLRFKNVCDQAFLTGGAGGGAVNVGDEFSISAGGVVYQAGANFRKDLTADAAAAVGVQIESLTLQALNQNNDTAIVRILLSKLDRVDGELNARIQKDLVVQAQNNGANIVSCLDPIEQYQKSAAAILCKNTCPNNDAANDSLRDPECATQNLSNPEQNNMNEVFRRCNMAIEESVAEMRREVCRELGVWDDGNSRCRPLLSRFATNCSNNGNIETNVMHFQGAFRTGELANHNMGDGSNRTFTWNCAQGPTYAIGGVEPSREPSTTCDVGGSNWTAWDRNESEVCLGEVYDKTRTCTEDSSVTETVESVGTNAGACTCGSGNSCQDDPSISSSGSPCSGRQPGETVTCSERSCSDLVCESDTCDASINFGSKAECEAAFSGDVSCVDNTPFPGYDSTSREITFSKCFPGRNRRCDRSVNLSTFFPEIASRESEGRPVAKVESRFNFAKYSDNPVNRSCSDGRGHLHSVTPTRTRTQYSDTVRRGRKWVDGGISVNFSNSNYNTLFWGHTGGWGDCGRTTCGGCLDTAQVTVFWEKVPTTSRWNCVAPRTVNCSSICNNFSCKPDTMPIGEWVGLCRNPTCSENGRRVLCD